MPAASRRPGYPTSRPCWPHCPNWLRDLDAEIFVVVEQDMYPGDFDVPLPIATRTRDYLNSEGLGAVPRPA